MIISTKMPPVVPEDRRRDGMATTLLGRIPSLDGLRALSICMVMWGHLQGSRFYIPGLMDTRRDWHFTMIGGMGVRIFFVISGFLITTLLLQEFENRGTISLKQFYIRRALRILPANYLYLGVLTVCAAVGLLAIDPPQLLSAALYLKNYFFKGNWQTGHLWSLAVEEQFYLIWPFTLVLLGKSRSMMIAAFAVVMATALRLHTEDPNTWPRFETSMDTLAFGGLLAGAWGRLGRNAIWQNFLGSRWFYLLPAAALAVGFTQRLGGAWEAVGVTVSGLAIAATIEGVVRYPRRTMGQILNTRIAVFWGTLSYSLYLWQQLWLFRGGTSVWNSFPANIGLTFLCALCSYRLVELPILKLRQRVSKKRSEASSGLRWRVLGRLRMGDIRSDRLAGTQGNAGMRPERPQIRT